MTRGQIRRHVSRLAHGTGDTSHSDAVSAIQSRIGRLIIYPATFVLLMLIRERLREELLLFLRHGDSMACVHAGTS